MPFRSDNFNAWGFINDRSQIARKEKSNNISYYTYNLSEADLDMLLNSSGLRDTERARISGRLNNPEMPVGGFCYGMSVTSVLAYYGALNPADLISGMRYLGEIRKDNCNASVRSALSYYQLLQYTDEIEQKSRETVRKSDADKLRPLIENLKAGKPVVLGYTYEGKRGEKNGHAVVAYGIEERNDSMYVYSKGDFRYDTHILIYDNADEKHSEANDLYIDTKGRNTPNSTAWHWRIPKTDNPSENPEAPDLMIGNHSTYKNGCISLVLCEEDIMNCHGLFNGTAAQHSEYSNAGVSYVPLSGISTRGDYGLLEKAADGSMNAAADTNQISFVSDFADGSETAEGSSLIKASFDDTYGFFLAPKSGGTQAMSVSAEYENYMMDAAADSAGKMLFTPDAEIECQETAGNYQMHMIINREARTFDWYRIEISGRDGGNLKMQLQPDGSGLILSGDSLKNVTVHVNTYETEATRTFSTEYKAVRIYEADEKTVSIALDKDGDGVYETDLEPEAAPELLRGDADGDGAVTNKDAQMVLIAYTDSLGTGKVDLPDAAFNAADVDGDGKVGAGDAQYILVYYTENTIAGKPTKWEDLIST